MRTTLGKITLMLACMTLMAALPAFAQEGGEPLNVTCTFRNPLLMQGQDPSVVQHEGFYYLVQSRSANPGFSITKSPTLTGLATATPVDIYAPPEGTAYSEELWAPELLYLRGDWYIYYAADDGNNDNHRTYVLKADTDDPTGTWTFMGALFNTPELDRWSIDLTAFEYGEKLYAVWSGAGRTEDDPSAAFPQRLYIAEMSDPLTIVGDRVLIQTPDRSWEMSVEPISEGPQPFIHDGQLSIVYSADASWTYAYKLGLLRLDGDDPLDPEAWTKVGVVFEQSLPERGLYGTGHNSIPVQSPDGTEWWNIFHAKLSDFDGWDDRAIFMQRFTWNADGTPDFGAPLSPEVHQAIPSGETCGLVSFWTFDESSSVTMRGEPEFAQGIAGLGIVFDGEDDLVDMGMPLVSTIGSYTVSAWARLDDLSGGTIASQEGGIASAFALHIDDSGAFALTMTDIEGRIAVTAAASGPAEIGEWTHVAGVRYGAAGEIRLYVNGELAASESFTEDWRTNRSFLLGATREDGQRTRFFKGALDEVMVYNGALSPGDILRLAAAYP